VISFFLTILVKRKYENTCEKSSVQLYKKSVSIAAKLNVIRCITQECQISVCKALDLT